MRLHKSVLLDYCPGVIPIGRGVSNQAHSLKHAQKDYDLNQIESLVLACLADEDQMELLGMKPNTTLELFNQNNFVLGLVNKNETQYLNAIVSIRLSELNLVLLQIYKDAKDIKDIKITPGIRSYYVDQVKKNNLEETKIITFTALVPPFSIFPLAVLSEKKNYNKEKFISLNKNSSTDNNIIPKINNKEEALKKNENDKEDCENSYSEMYDDDDVALQQSLDFYKGNIYWDYVLQSDTIFFTPFDRNPPVFDFPFDKTNPLGGGYLCTQSCGGSMTHNTPYTFHAIDLQAEKGTIVYAVGDGQVISINETNSIGGHDVSLMDHYNSILIKTKPMSCYYHEKRKNNITNSSEDNPHHDEDHQNLLKNEKSFYIEYVHIAKDSCSEFGIKIGSQIKSGQKICRTGNVGFCPSPHLHIQAFSSASNQATSIPFKLLCKKLDSSHAEPQELIAGEVYFPSR